MQKSEIIEKMVERLEDETYNITRGEIRTQVKTVVGAILDAMSLALASGKRIEVRGFGSFSLKPRAAGFVRNPRYNTMIESDGRNVVYFRAGKNLADKVDKINRQEIAKPAKKTKGKTKPRKEI